VAVRVDLGASEELEDARLHALGDDVLEALGLLVHLVPAVAEDLDQEHLEQAVMADELDRDAPSLPRQLLAAVTVVLYQPLRRESRNHLAHRRR
jgi:hypothetical protein